LINNKSTQNRFVYGKTEQIISIKNQNNFPNEIKANNYLLQFIGYSEKAVDANYIIGNNFIIVLRDLSDEEIKIIENNYPLVKNYGIPNYFDNQRFGSNRHRKGFIGKEIFLGNREEALKLFYQPSKFDKSEVKKYKELVIRNWGKWDKINYFIPGNYGKIIRYLSQKGHGKSFTKALSLIEKNLMIIIIRSYTSYLFNELVNEFFLKYQRIYNLKFEKFKYYVGEFLFYRELPDEFLRKINELYLPEPAYDTNVINNEINEILNNVLKRENIELSQLKVKKIYGVNVHSKDRKLIVFPENFELLNLEEDELYKNKYKLTLKFFLPKGSYATILIKRLLLNFNL